MFETSMARPRPKSGQLPPHGVAGPKFEMHPTSLLLIVSVRGMKTIVC